MESLETNFKIVATVKLVGYSVTFVACARVIHGSNERVVIYTFSLICRVVYLSVVVRLSHRKFLIADPI